MTNKQTKNSFEQRLEELKKQHRALCALKNKAIYPSNGIFERYENPILTAEHVPLFWKYDLNKETNPYLMQRFGFNSVFNAGALKWQGRYLLFLRVEGYDRKSFFALAESKTGIDQFEFWDQPLALPELDGETNVYDMRITAHEDGWIYGFFCSERQAYPGSVSDTSSAIASTGIIRTKDLKNWERLPNLVSKSHQRNVVLHPEFVAGKYALYTRPQDEFIEAGKGGGIHWSLIDDIEQAEVKEETLLNERFYHTIKEAKNGEGPHPIKTDRGWLHLAHGVRNCAAGLRYVLYLYVTDLEQPTKIIAEPAGYLMAPQGIERVGDVSNVLFANGWITDDDGKVYIYYASSDTRMHVATSTVDRLLDYCFHTAADGYTTSASLKVVNELIEKNKKLLNK